MLDFLIVGSGLTGATIARELHDAGKDVLVIDRRSHHGGNVHDFLRHGVRVHTYGPHYFRTNNPRIWEWVNRYADWAPYEAVLATQIDGGCVPWPIQASWLRARQIDPTPPFTGEPTNFAEACLAMMPEKVYRLFVEGYTAKQWGVDPSTLDASLAGRFDLRTDGDLRLKQHRWQAIPAEGYAAWTASILDGIPLQLDTDWLRTYIRAGHVVYTGPIDEMYGFDLGRLAYRAQRRDHHWRRVDRWQEHVQVNNPGKGDHIRSIEWRHMMPDTSGCNGTIVTTETPYTPTDPDRYEYPFPDARNRTLFQQYAARAKADPTITVCGRLGEYRYYDMDQAIGRALRIAHRLAA